MVLSAKRVIDPVLTRISQGYKNGAYVGSHLFPEVLVDKEGNQIPQFGADHFKIWQTKRAPRADSNYGQIADPTMISVVLEEHDIVFPIDYREEAESMFNEERRKARAAQDVIDLGKEYRQAVLAQTTGSYASGHTVGLTGDDCWSNHTEDANLSTPIADVELGKETIRSKIGVRPNVGVMGATTFEVLKDHPTLLELIKYSQRGVLTIELLQEIFGIPHLFVGDAIYSTDAGSFVDVWSDIFAMAYVPMNEGERSEDEPSFGYTLRKKNYSQVDTFMTNGGKIKNVRCTDIYKPSVTGNTAGYIITNTKA